MCKRAAWILLFASCAEGAPEVATAAPAPAARRPKLDAPAERPEHAGEEHAIDPAAIAGPAANARPRPFEARVQIDLGVRPIGVAIEDLDGDGAAELLATTEDPGELRVWRCERGGIEPQPLRIPVGGWPLRPLIARPGSFGAPADRRPVIVASRETREISIVVPGTEPPRRLTLLDSRPRALDLATRGPLAEVLVVATEDRLLFVDPAGQGPSLAHGAATFPRAVCALPDQDTVVVAYQQPPSLVAWSRATGAQTQRVDLPSIPRALCALDLDRDGDDELALACGENDVWVLGLGAAGGVERALAQGLDVAQRAGSGNVPIALAVLPSRQQFGLVSVYGLSAELFGRAAQADMLVTSLARVYAGQSPVDIALGDLDADGRADAAVANRDSATVSLLFATEQAPLGEEQHAFAGMFPVSVAVQRELDGGGALRRARAIVCCSKDASVSILGAERGDRLRLERTFAGGSAPHSGRWIDFNGDGLSDLVWLWANAEGARMALRLARSPTQFEERDPLGDLQVGVSASDIAFLAGDAQRPTECFVADPDAGNVVVVRAGEARAFALPSAPRALAWVAFDDDPERELAVALGAPGPRTGVAVLDVVRDADGWPKLQELAFAPSELRPLDLVALHLNDDAREDLLVLSRESDLGMQGTLESFVRTDAPAHFFSDARADAGLMPHHLQWCELDGETLVAVPSQNMHAVLLWRVRREGSAFELQRLDDVGAHLGCIDLDFADVSGDGRVDLLIANCGTDDVSVLHAHAAPR